AVARHELFEHAHLAVCGQPLALRGMPGREAQGSRMPADKRGRDACLRKSRRQLPTSEQVQSEDGQVRMHVRGNQARGSARFHDRAEDARNDDLRAAEAEDSAQDARRIRESR
ncbi:MAG: hypothetical protein COT25_04720, partial [Candidatus Kerfeldbacteria bacterium CG08_land_8_20_14_0_20_42_7]